MNGGIDGTKNKFVKYSEQEMTDELKKFINDRLQVEVDKSTKAPRELFSGSGVIPYREVSREDLENFSNETLLFITTLPKGIEAVELFTSGSIKMF